MTVVGPMKVKILFVSSDKYPPFRVDVSVLFGKEIVSRGHKVDWILQSGSECKSGYRTTWDGGRVWVGRNSSGQSLWARINRQVSALMHDLKMFRLAQMERYDVVQVKDKFVGGVLGLIAAKKNRAKFVFWMSFPYPEAALYRVKEGVARYPLVTFARGKLQKYLLYKIILPNADHVFVQSDQMKRDVCEYAISGHKVTPVPMGISLDDLMASREGVIHNEIDKGFAIVYIGTLVKVRRIDFLVRVLALVKRHISSVRLYLVGDGEDRSDREVLVNEAKRLGVGDSLVITGFLPRGAALAYVEKADVCVSPYYPTPVLNSTSPTKLIEYMAMSRPVVANNHPEQELIIRESNAGICTPYDELEFSNAIEQILKNPGAAREMGKRGRKYVEKNRTYDKIADIIEQEYYRLRASSSL